MLESIVEFDSKNEVFDYIRDKFSSKSRLILVRGSTAFGPAKMFSDFDVEVYADSAKKPYYEIALLKQKPVLLSVYFYRFRRGNNIKAPKKVRVLFGEYNDAIKPDFSEDNYSQKERVIRECQLAIDFFFKYLRTKDKKCLESVQKRIK